MDLRDEIWVIRPALWRLTIVLKTKIHKDRVYFVYFYSPQFVMLVPLDLLLKLCLNTFKMLCLGKLHTCVQCILTTSTLHSLPIMFSFDIILDHREIFGIKLDIESKPITNKI